MSGNSCDAVIPLTSGGRTQKLVDAAELRVTSDPKLILACDWTHLRVHWAGDLDHDGRLDMLVTVSHKYIKQPN